MDTQTILICVLIVVAIVAVAALAWLFIELARTAKTTREGLSPTLDNVQKLTKDLQPTIEKTDPLMERVNLTVDALNLELMRVDKLLSDLGDVTATASSAAGAMDTVTKAPANLVNNVTDKLHGFMNGRKASAASAQLAEAAASTAALRESGTVSAPADASQPAATAAANPAEPEPVDPEE